MANTVFIYTGIPGSGKTTVIGKRHRRTVPVCSADHWFMRLKQGVYNYVPAEIGQAHAACLRKFVGLVIEADIDIVVDNTNTSVAEVAPYAALALAYGREVKIITVECDPEVAFARNVHGVPLQTIKAMHAQLEARVLAPWWPQETLTQ
jgi:dephospho-CoA kinase